MATPLDTALVPQIKTIVDLLGASAVFTERTAGSYDPATGSYSGETETEHTVKCTPPDDYKRMWGDGLVIEAGDTQIGLPASGITFTPENSMKVVVGGKTWQIVAVKPVYTGEDIGIYLLNLRGGR